MNWQKLNKALMIIYFFLSLIFAIVLFYPNVWNIGLLQNCGVSCQETSTIFALVIIFLIGAVTYITSYKALLLKLIPVVILYSLIWIFLLIAASNGAGEGGMILPLITKIVFGYSIFLFIITSIAKFIAGRLKPKNKINKL